MEPDKETVDKARSDLRVEQGIMTTEELRLRISRAIRRGKIPLSKGASLLIYLAESEKPKRKFRPRPVQKTKQLDEAVRELEAQMQKLEAQEAALQGRTN